MFPWITGFTGRLKLAGLFLSVLAATVCHATESSSLYFAARPGALAKAKARLAAHDTAMEPALQALIKAADKALNVTPPSVVEKATVPPSGDKHDYMTIAPYFWPNPAKTNGLPYIRHDGRVNPASREDAWDHGRIGQMANTVETLSLAYYFTGNEAYARHAADCLRVWFLNPATYMNPNLEFAQAVMGENTGRGTGILEGRNISQAADAAQLLANSPAWPAEDQKRLKAWLDAYLNWLLTSKNGLAEAKAANNHGTWYDVQAMELALILGKTDVAKRIADEASTRRIAKQIKPDGSQPLELARTAALGYSQFNLAALYILATQSEYVGVDLWHTHLADGRNALQVALDFLTPYIGDHPKAWPYQQIKNFNPLDLAPQIRAAAVMYNQPEYEKMLAGLPQSDHARFQLLFPGPPASRSVSER